ncbi:LOB domain-containing protein 16-like [Hibiscus syriacus]|uniref:LOB domain-containing protein 16-like n=1 Tax=Hibiscus syriacus TaxID=106335 RepID=A0A6A2XBZ3_HIBSY|nr:diacylglycerol lipase-beta-like [Hibiscus syriacus]KAE8673113.1 LOB domain-containing protein 16-like [Hibiscus syriacus]
MANQYCKRFFRQLYNTNILIRRQKLFGRVVNGILNRCQSQWSNSDGMKELNKEKEAKTVAQVSLKAEVDKKAVSDADTRFFKFSSGDEDNVDNTKWKLELAWLTKALEPALQLCRWALPIGNDVGDKLPSSTRSVSEIISSIQKSKTVIEGWSLSDLTLGLYLIYLRQASLNPFEDVKGVKITSDSIVQDLIYHMELARGCYKSNAAILARTSMLRESNVLKFVKDSSVMRPGYYIGIDPRRKLVIFGIRGTHTAYDLFTDIVTSSDGDVTFEGYSTHFGTAESAGWFLQHEIGTIRKCLEKYEGYRLRLVGHSLGAATASLLAIMLRKKSKKELGFSPDIVSAVGFATPPCVSKELAETCSDFVTTIVMQDDIVPRLSAASLAQLRNEILQTDWMSVVEKADWKTVVDFVTNAKLVVSSVQDVARKLSDYAHFNSKKESSDGATKTEATSVPQASKFETKNVAVLKGAYNVPLFVPGTVYYLKRNVETDAGSGDNRGQEYFTLWRRNPGEHFQRIVLSNNLISDHRCDSHLYALRDVLKGLPMSHEEDIFI